MPWSKDADRLADEIKRELALELVGLGRPALCQGMNQLVCSLVGSLLVGSVSNAQEIPDPLEVLGDDRTAEAWRKKGGESVDAGGVGSKTQHQGTT